MNRFSILWNTSLTFSTTSAIPAALIISWSRSLLYRNQSTDFQSKSMDWFLYDRSLHHKRVRAIQNQILAPLQVLVHFEDPLSMLWFELRQTWWHFYVCWIFVLVKDTLKTFGDFLKKATKAYEIMFFDM